MPEQIRPRRPHSFSFVVADGDGGFTEFALHLSPDILEHVDVCLREIQRHHDIGSRVAAVKARTPVKAVLPFRRRKRSA